METTTLGNYVFEERIKNRLNALIKLKNPDFVIKQETYEDVAPNFIKVLECFKDLSDKNIKEGISYLFDTVGYYMVLTKEANILNEEVITAYTKLFEEYLELLGGPEDDND